MAPDLPKCFLPLARTRPAVATCGAGIATSGVSSGANEIGLQSSSDELRVPVQVGGG